MARYCPTLVMGWGILILNCYGGHKNCFVKMFFCVLSFTFSCCGAGTAADTENVTELISSNLELHRLSTGRKVSYVSCVVFWAETSA